MPRPIILPREPSVFDKLLPFIQQMAFSKYQQNMQVTETERRDKIRLTEIKRQEAREANKLSAAKRWDLLLKGFTETDEPSGVKVNGQGYVGPEKKKTIAERLYKEHGVFKIADGLYKYEKGKLISVGKEGLATITAGENDKFGYTKGTVYQLNTKTGKPQLIPREKTPILTEIDKFKAMLAESSPAMKKKYGGKLVQWKLDLKTAGASNVIQNINTAKFDIQKDATAGALLGTLKANKGDKNTFDANGFQYNNVNTQNKVAYWDEGKGFFKFAGTRIVKLPKKLTDAGWTPAEIQKAAVGSGQTVKQVLAAEYKKYGVDLGLLK